MLEAFAWDTAPLECSLASVGVFPTEEGVVFLAPVVTRELLDLHQEFQMRLDEFGARCSAYYRPGAWVPHCTLATGVARAAVPQAVPVCLDAALPIRARFERVALVEFWPVKVLYAFDLAGA